MLLNSSGTNVWAENDPKFVSIANDNVNWLLLRSDGTVFKVQDITKVGTTQPEGQLIQWVKIPTAIAITTGKGPEPCS